MPLDSDYEFGKMAVRRGVLQQNQLEECVEVLVALERVGSRKRLWDIVAEKDYVNPSVIASIRREIGGKGARASAEFSEELLKEETRDDMPPPVPPVGGFVLAHLKSDGSAQVHPLPQRLVLLGADPACDLVINEPNVDRIHARITCGQGQFTLADNGSKAGVLVNGRPETMKALASYDRIKLGAARFVFLPEFGEEPAPQTDSPSTLTASPMGRLRITGGPDKGSAFFVGAQTLLIGKHKLANVRLHGPGVADFHAQAIPTAEGVRLIDLGSPGGTVVNGARVTKYVLLNDDTIRIGAFTISYQDLRPPVPTTGEPSASESPAATPAPAADGNKKEWNLDFSLDAEVDVPEDPLVRAGIKAADETPDREPVVKPYKPGELALVCIEGPAEGREFVIRKRRTMIGRDKTANIRIEVPSVSRRHAEIVLDRTQTSVADLGSRNGIYVNGKRVKRKALAVGNTIRIGECLFIAQKASPFSRGR